MSDRITRAEIESAYETWLDTLNRLAQEETDELKERLTSALSREKALREALRVYGFHRSGCRSLAFGICTCGYEGMLKGLHGQPVEPKEVTREELAETIRCLRMKWKIDDRINGEANDYVADHLLTRFDIRRKG